MKFKLSKVNLDDPQNQARIFSLFIFFAVWKAFYPCLNNAFMNFDDQEYVYDNNHVKAGLTLATIRWCFLSTTSLNWHPLTMLSHVIDWQLFGPNPAGHHLTSVVLHCINIVLAFQLFWLLTGALKKSFLLALIFGLHPLRVESVAWISERKDVLSTLFWMLAIIAFAKYALLPSADTKRRRLFYCLSMFVFLLGLLSKPMIVTLPFLLILLDVWPLRRVGTVAPFQLFWEKVPFFALSTAFAVITSYTKEHCH
jgi:hypothetical protein